MRYFDTGTSLKQDKCAQELRTIENDQILQHYLTLNDPQNACLNDMFYQNQNLRCKNGYGFTNGENVDCDTRLRYADPKNIRGPDPQQLFPRTFVAVPDLSSGTFIPDIESQLIHGHDTFVDNGCKSLSEMNFERTKFLNPCVKKKVVDGFNSSLEHFDRAGVATRDTKCYRYNERKRLNPEDLIKKRK